LPKWAVFSFGSEITYPSVRTNFYTAIDLYGFQLCYPWRIRSFIAAAAANPYAASFDEMTVLKFSVTPREVRRFRSSVRAAR
jgi:hypothetical protein